MPNIELDELHWKPNWEERADEEFLQLVEEAVSQESWVVDGNYSVVRHLVWPKATTIIWLDFPFPLVLFRAIKRSIVRVATKEPLYSSNVESFRHTFMSRESIILWVIKTHKIKRVRYTELLSSERVKGCDVRIFKSPADLESYVQALNDGPVK